MSVKIYNRKTMAQKLVDEKRATVVDMYKGVAKNNVSGSNAESWGRLIVEPSQAVYNGSAGEAKIMADIEQLQKIANSDPQKVLTADELKKFNAAQFPGQTAIEALLGKMYIDITRRAQEAGDLTSLIATEANDPNSDQTVNVNYFSKYVGKMDVVSGSNDSVNLIEQKLGATDTFSQNIYALGWKDSLKNLLFNKVHDMAKVNQAAADADVDKRNELTVGAITGATYVTSQKQAADTTGTTFDVKMYNTMRKAIKKLRNLKDPQTDRKITVPGISILCNSLDAWDIERVISGQLGTGGGTNVAQNFQTLPINSIIEYDQGRTDGLVYGKDTLSFSGVTAGTCYIFVPNEYMFVMNKRGLTLETGMGSVLQLSTEEKAWYRVFGVWSKDFLGSSYTGTSLGAGYGAVIEVTLPTDS